MRERGEEIKICIRSKKFPSLRVQETERRIQETQERERMNLNKVILEERKWYCGFVAAFSKSLVSS